MDSIPPGSILTFVSTVVFNPAYNSAELISGILMILLFTGLSALMSSSETALFSLSYGQLREMEKSTSVKDRAIARFLDRPERLLGTILVGNNIFNLVIVALVYRVTVQLLGPAVYSEYAWVWMVQIIVTTFLIVIFAKVIPKIYATHHNMAIARISIRPLQLLYFLLNPIVRLLTFSSAVLEKRLEKYHKGVSAREIDQAIDKVSVQDEKGASGDTRILKGIVKFGNIQVTQIMCSRVDVVWVDLSVSFHELLDIVRNSGYSRIPVCDGDFDKTEGIVYAKDLLSYLDEEDGFGWHKLIKPALFIPESKKIDALLEEFQSKRVHMAIVVDEYGGCSGLVTLEDVLEEVIGEIKDEFDDVHEIDYRKIDDHNYLFEGKTAVNDACKVMDLPSETFDAYRGESDSIAGLFLELKGELPVVEDEIELNGFTFKVMEMNATRIVKVKVTIHE